MNVDNRLRKEKIEELLDRSVTEEEYKDIVTNVLYQLLDENEISE